MRTFFFFFPPPSSGPVNYSGGWMYQPTPHPPPVDLPPQHSLPAARTAQFMCPSERERTLRRHPSSQRTFWRLLSRSRTCKGRCGTSNWNGSDLMNLDMEYLWCSQTYRTYTMRFFFSSLIQPFVQTRYRQSCDKRTPPSTVSLFIHLWSVHFVQCPAMSLNHLLCAKCTFKWGGWEG